MNGLPFDARLDPAAARRDQPAQDPPRAHYPLDH
jgi:hypothetical protein